MGDQPRVGAHEFGQGPLQISQPTGAAIDFVTNSETGDAFAQFFDNPGEIHAQNGRQIGRQGQVFARALDHGVDGVHARRFDAQHHMTGGGQWARQFGFDKGSISAVAGEGHEFHRSIFR